MQESLEEINLEGNNISEIESGTFSGLKHLRIVNLRNNSLRTLPRSSLKVSPTMGKVLRMIQIMHYSVSRYQLDLPRVFQPLPL